MKKILVRKYTDFDIKITNKYYIQFLDKFTGKNYEYPILYKDNITLNIPEYCYNLLDFMNERKEELVEEEDITLFLELLDVEIIPFIWLLMKDASIDIYCSKESLYVIDFEKDRYIVFNSKNMDISIFDKMYRNQIRSNNSFYNECKDELYGFVRTRIQNSIGHNEFVNNEMQNYKFTQKEMEKEFLKLQSFDLKKSLFLYENLIRIKEQYLKENHYLLSEETIEEIVRIVEEIRKLITNPPKYHTKNK